MLIWKGLWWRIFILRPLSLKKYCDFSLPCDIQVKSLFPTSLFLCDSFPSHFSVFYFLSSTLMAKTEDGERRKTSKLQHLDTLLERGGSIRHIFNIYLFKAVVNKCLKTNYNSNMILHICISSIKLKIYLARRLQKIPLSCPHGSLLTSVNTVNVKIAA